MPAPDLRAWLARQLERLEALDALADDAPWDANTRAFAYLDDLDLSNDANLALAARNLTPGLITYGRHLLEQHAPCVEHHGCTGCSTCGTPNAALPCPALGAFAGVFAHRSGYRPEWKP